MFIVLEDLSKNQLVILVCNPFNNRSSRSQMFFETCVLKKFAIFAAKQLWCSFFIIKTLHNSYPAIACEKFNPGKTGSPFCDAGIPLCRDEIFHVIASSRQSGMKK